MAAGKQRVDGQPAYVLHSYPFRETSLIVEVFARDYGRVGVVARGARRAKSALRGVLLAFQPLSLGWFGQGEVKTLANAEWQGGQPLLAGQALLCGYYLNELLLRLLPRDDPHPGLFARYAETLGSLAGGARPQPLLRRFEQSLLRELGYGLTLDKEADSGAPVRSDADYAYIIERGPVPVQQAPQEAPRVSGSVLLAMAEERYDDPDTLAQAKNLMRQLIAHYLGGQALQSRRVFMEFQEL